MSVAVIVAEPQRQLLLPALRCAAAGHHVALADSPAAAAEDALRLVVVEEAHAAAVLQLLHERGGRARVLIVATALHPGLVRMAAAHPRVVGLTATPTGAPEPWETTYITRRVLAPADPTPTASQFLSWGVTNVAWTPGSTEQLRRIVRQIEDIARNLGADRREAGLVATASHELLMNAMYDAPVDASGQPLHAFDRQADVALIEANRPTFRLVVGPTHLGLDVSDPFGRLARARFFDAIVRGQTSRELDTSHGGAGLGLHMLYQQGSVLRVELRPMRETHVSWMLRRGAAHRARDAERSLFFVPLTETP